MTTTPSKQERADAIDFVLAECVRIQDVIAKAIAGKKLKDLPKEDVWAMLPHPGGTGEIHIGNAAYNRLHALSGFALRESHVAERANPSDVFDATKRLVSERFLSGKQPVTPDTVEAMFADAIAEATDKCRDRTHFIPCRLMYVKTPDQFAIGPVTFRITSKFIAQSESAFAAYVADAKNESDEEWSQKHLDEAKAYYEAFTWTAEVNVLGCAPPISKERAFVAVETAVNVLRILFGHYHTDRMTVGGVRKAQDRRAHIHITETGKLDVSTSSDSTSAVSFSDDWSTMFDREDVKFMMDGASKMLAPTVDPSLQHPLSARLVDALKWYGEAVLEETPASRIVKAVTAIERLVMTGEKVKITKTVTKRAAMLLCKTGLETDFQKTVDRMDHFYDLRSGLAHGRLSPFDPVVAENASACLRFAERTIGSGLVFLHSYNVLHQALTLQELSNGYSTIVDEVEKAATPPATPSLAKS